MSKPMFRPALALCAVAAASTLAGCVGFRAEGSGPPPLNPASRFALAVEPGVERIALAVHEGGPSQNQSRALQDLAGRFGAENAPVLRIEAPSGEDPVAGEMAWGVRNALASAGVPAERLVLATYAAPDPRAPVLVGFDTVRAAVPRCGTSWTNLAGSGSNAGYANFGCAVNANLAAQIANPRDITTPRAMTPPDSGRRAVVLDRYRRGEQTAADIEELIENGQVSDAVD
jgi:pilus assembly protein CpaD